MKNIIALIVILLICNITYSQVLPKEVNKAKISTKAWFKKVTPSNRTLIDVGLYAGMIGAFATAYYGSEVKNPKIYKSAAYIGFSVITLQVCNMSFSKDGKNTMRNKNRCRY